jgi:large subunit ribosomal protein L6
MSRIGRKPVNVPANVKVSVADSTIKIEGPKGKLAFPYRDEMTVSFDEAAKVISVKRNDDERLSRSLHGLTRSLIANMVHGVSEGFTKKLEIVGVGFQAQLKSATSLGLQVGYANQVVMNAPEGVTVALPDPTHIVISGPDKQKVGQFAAEVRTVRPPEPYKGKGIRYEGEVVRRKSGKAFGAK